MRGLRLGEAVLAAFILLLGGFIAVETAMLRTGPGYAAIGPKLFPWLVAGGLLLVGVALLHEARAGTVAQPAGFELDLPLFLRDNPAIGKAQGSATILFQSGFGF